MEATQLYSRILGLAKPWKVVTVNLALPDDEVEVIVAHSGGKLTCPKCGKPCPGYDKRQRRWRHLDTCQLKTLLIADIPRVKCPEHGVVTLLVPWAEAGSSFTALFESSTIDLLRETPVSTVAKRLRTSWNAVDGIMQRAVKRGLARRKGMASKRLNVDETRYRKKHGHLTVVTDQESGTVLYVADDRHSESLKGFYATLTEQQKTAIEAVCMDMWPAYIRATREVLQDADNKIAFDRHHVSQHLTKVVDQVRSLEQYHLKRKADELLKDGKSRWIRNRGKMVWQQQRKLSASRRSSLKTTHAWAMKDFAVQLWDSQNQTWALQGWRRLIDWMSHSHLKPVQETGTTLNQHMWGIANAVALKTDNSPPGTVSQSINTVQTRAHGFRNKQRFRNAIYFHLGGLLLYPEEIST